MRASASTSCTRSPLQRHHDNGNRDDVERLHADAEHIVACKDQALAGEDKEYGEELIPSQFENSPRPKCRS